MAEEVQAQEQPTTAQQISFIQRRIVEQAIAKYTLEVGAAVEQLKRAILINQHAQSNMSYTEREAWNKDLKALVDKAVEKCLPSVRMKGAEAFLKQFDALITSIPELQEMAYQQGRDDS